jgi:type I restriction enzyme S subunit
MSPVPLKRIGEVAKAKGGKRLPKGMEVQDEETAHPYLRVVDFGPDGIVRSDIKFIPNEAFDCVSRYTITSDDIYVSIAGTIGRVGIVPDDLSGANLTENAAKITEISSSVDKRYLLYFLRSAAGQGALQGKAGGTSQPKLALFRIEEIDFPCPPLRDQQAIASTLSAYDELIENNRRRMALLEVAARQLYREWFVRLRFPGHEHTRITNGVPQGWERKTLAELCESIDYGYTASAEQEEVGPKLLRITDIVPDFIDWTAVPYCGIEDRTMVKFRLCEGDIVVARTGATVGYAKRLHKRHPDAVFASYLVRLRFKPELDNLMAGVFVESEDYRSYVRSRVGGAAQPNANAKILAGAEILVPPPILQRSFREFVEPLIDQRDILQLQNRKLRAARDLSLPRLMSGAIRV